MGEAVMMSEGGGGVDGQCLKKMVLRVLLVEADDATRQIIAALLRKCSYRGNSMEDIISRSSCTSRFLVDLSVICNWLLERNAFNFAAVPDGLKAWEILKERRHNIDLVLTEVELPSISGYALLTLIVEHDMCKNIPVIMMSSKDSISTVLKCLAKGASDFLMKPVRKNELRNLWQHVWRRKTQSAGSRPWNEVVENQKIAVSENEAASNYSSENFASIQRGNDKSGGDAQGIKDIRCKDASNMCDEECIEMVERSFMPKSKPLANMTSSGIRTSCTGPYSSVAINSEEGSLCAEPRSHSENTCTVDEDDCRLNELSSAPCTEAVDLIGKFENCSAENGDSDERKEKSNVASRLGLCLRTFNPSCSNDDGSREHNMISHPKVSAFAKYENKKTIQYLLSGLTSNSGPFKEGSSASTLEHVAPLTESEHNATALVMRQPGNCKAAISDNQLSSILVESGYQQAQSPKSQSPLPTSSYSYSYSEVQNLEHDKQPFDDTTVHSEDNAEEADNGKLVTVEKAKYDSATCGSSDLGSGVTSKISISRCGSTSNEAIESSYAVASPGRDPASENVNYNDTLSHDRTRAENNCTSQREAALMKFRLKRKDRCFDKKVRYQSRKRLAEQRPRVKGQFVRQLQNEA